MSLPYGPNTYMRSLADLIALRIQSLSITPES